MNNGKGKSRLIVFLGAIIFGVFVSISFISMVDNDRYFLSTGVIEAINYNNGKLTVRTNNEVVSVCVKQTKSEPSLDSLCWTNTKDNVATISIYEYKTYHIWVKDNQNIITYYNKYNTQEYE